MSTAPITLPNSISHSASNDSNNVDINNGLRHGYQELKTWLPEAFDGFDSKLVESFIANLRDDFGFVSTEDLHAAKIEGQLSFEGLKGINHFKIGHFNRLMKRLELLGYSA